MSLEDQLAAAEAACYDADTALEVALGRKRDAKAQLAAATDAVRQATARRDPLRQEVMRLQNALERERGGDVRRLEQGV